MKKTNKTKRGGSTTPTSCTAYYPLFEHMEREHGLVLVERELYEIMRVVEPMVEPKCKAICPLSDITKNSVQCPECGGSGRARNSNFSDALNDLYTTTCTRCVGQGIIPNGHNPNHPYGGLIHTDTGEHLCKPNITDNKNGKQTK